MSNACVVEISASDGRLLRCAADEPDAWAVPYDLAYSSTIPGGDETCTFSLRVRIDKEVPFSLLDDVRVYTKGNQTLWEGMVAKMPRQSGEDFLMNVQCVGHSARLKWPTGFKEIYIDRDLSRWQGPSSQRRLGRMALSITPIEGGLVTGGTVPAIETAIEGTWTQVQQAESWYDAGGIRLAALYANWERSGSIVNPSDVNWNWAMYLSSDDLVSTNDGTGNLRAAGPSSAVVAATGTEKTWALMQLFYNAAGGTDGVKFSIMWSDVKVIGAHGLPDFYGHSAIADVVSRAAPDLTYTTGPEGSIVDNTGLEIPQLAFLTPTTAEDAILEINKYFEWEWGCRGREFFWRPADPDRLCWEARLDQGIYLGLEGDDADGCVNGFLVTYTLPDRTTKTAGPIGSGCDVEDAVLGDSDPLNIVNAQGIAAKYGSDTISTVTDDKGAVQFGFAKMAELALPARKGQITLTSNIDHPTKGSRPVSEVRAGDWVRISDHPADVPRRIIKASHSPDQRQCVIDVGADIPKVDAMIAEIDALTKLAGF